MSAPQSIARPRFFGVLALCSAWLGLATIAPAQIALQTLLVNQNAAFFGNNLISADGTTFVFTVGLTDNYLWNATTGVTPIGRSNPASSQDLSVALSGDGSTVVGWARTGPSGSRLFTPVRWTAADGYTNLATPTLTQVFNTPQAVSHDGSAVSVLFQNQNYRWTAGGGLTSAPDLPRSFSTDGTTYVTSTAYIKNGTAVPLGSTGLQPADNWTTITPVNVSGNGSVVVGSVFNGLDYSDPGFHSQAFRWTEAGGFELLGYIPGFRESDAISVSADGNIITGYYGPDDPASPTYYPFIWDPVSGIRDLSTALTSAGLDMTGWSLFENVMVAADGSTIIGNASYNGQSAVFRVTGYSFAAIPEPAHFALGAGGLMLGLLAFRRIRPAAPRL